MAMVAVYMGIVIVSVISAFVFLFFIAWSVEWASRKDAEEEARARIRRDLLR